jgi:hypothetical protein
MNRIFRFIKLALKDIVKIFPCIFTGLILGASFIVIVYSLAYFFGLVTISFINLVCWFMCLISSKNVELISLCYPFPLMYGLGVLFVAYPLYPELITNISKRWEESK